MVNVQLVKRMDFVAMKSSTSSGKWARPGFFTVEEIIDDIDSLDDVLTLVQTMREIQRIKLEKVIRKVSI